MARRQFRLLSATLIGPKINLFISILLAFSPIGEGQRPKRQFARYICGIPPYIFHSDWPCPMWGLCANHGFTTNLPCANNQTCVERNPNTECVQGTCCTLPIVVTPSSAGSSPWPGIQTWPGSPATSEKTSSAANARPYNQFYIFLFFLSIWLYFH